MLLEVHETEEHFNSLLLRRKCSGKCYMKKERQNEEIPVLSVKLVFNTWYAFSCLKVQ